MTGHGGHATFGGRSVPIRGWSMTPASAPHPDEAGFLDAIRAEPAEDTHRLVYADWLDEHGRPERAAFIRTQVALEREPEYIRERARRLAREHGAQLLHHARPRSAYELALREHELLADACARRQSDHPWLDVLLDDYDEAGGSHAEFRRGFAQHLTCSAADWLRHADAILALHPVERITLTTWPEAVWTPPKWAAGGYHLFAGDPAARPIPEADYRSVAEEWLDANAHRFLADGEHRTHLLILLRCRFGPGLAFELPLPGLGDLVLPAPSPPG